MIGEPVPRRKRGGSARGIFEGWRTFAEHGPVAPRRRLRLAGDGHGVVLHDHTDGERAADRVRRNSDNRPFDPECAT